MTCLRSLRKPAALVPALLLISLASADPPSALADWNTGLGGRPDRAGFSSEIGPTEADVLWQGGRTSLIAFQGVCDGDLLVTHRMDTWDVDAGCWVVAQELPPATISGAPEVPLPGRRQTVPVPNPQTRIRLSEDRRKEILESLAKLYDDGFDEELSAYRAERLLEFFLRALGPAVYNQAIQDARGFMLEKLEDLDVEFYDPGEAS